MTCFRGVKVKFYAIAPVHKTFTTLLSLWASSLESRLNIFINIYTLLLSVIHSQTFSFPSQAESGLLYYKSTLCVALYICHKENYSDATRGHYSLVTHHQTAFTRMPHTQGTFRSSTSTLKTSRWASMCVFSGKTSHIPPKRPPVACKPWQNPNKTPQEILSSQYSSTPGADGSLNRRWTKRDRILHTAFRKKCQKPPS